MKYKIFLPFLLLFVFSLSAQKAQRVAYIDMEYILENTPEYLDAQNILDAKVTTWRAELDKLSRFIENLKTDLTNERAILTNDIILEKEDEIALKQKELRRLESLYFGPKGDMFLLRKQLIKPVQDQVYNALQNIASKQRYDFVFDKSSELIMLYSNKKYDISDLVLQSITRDRKIKLNKEKRESLANPKKELTEAQKAAILKREAADKKREDAREAKKEKIEELRKKRQAQIEEKRKILQAKKEAAKKKKKKKEDNKD